MTDWLKGCEVCNAGLCDRFDELIKSGCSQREAARQLEVEQAKKLGEIVYSSSSLLNRYHRNKPQVFRNGTLNEFGGKAWPMCSVCGQRAVSPNGKGVCRSCSKRAREEVYRRERKKKYDEGQTKLDQVPIDQESEQYWSGMAEKLHDLFGGFGDVPCGKVSKETLDEVGEILRSIRFLHEELFEKHIFVLK